jgi:phenylalanyl-tRNA synthetase alpha chain
MLERLAELDSQATAALAEVNDAAALEAFRVEYLGTKGQLKAAMAWLKDAGREEKPALGQGLNALKNRLQEQYDAKKASLGEAQPKAAGPVVDVTEPPCPRAWGAAMSSRK